MKMVAK